MNWMQHLTQAFLTIVLLALGLAAYDRMVRVPHTPRLALVDVNSLYAAAQRQAAEAALSLVSKSGAKAESKEGIGDQVASAALGQIERTAADFGPKLTQTLTALAEECQCTVVSMAAVYGRDSGIPDYTAAVAERLHLGAVQ